MKRFIIALIFGLILGYEFGYKQGADGEPSIQQRIMTKFGADRVKASQDSVDARVRDAEKGSAEPST